MPEVFNHNFISLSTTEAQHYLLLITGEFLVIVEYCRFGNLQNYLIKNRNTFVNEVDKFGNRITKEDNIEAEELDNLARLKK